VAAEPLDLARARAEQLLGPENVAVVDSTLRLAADPSDAGRVGHALWSAGLVVTELRPLERTLEEVFLEMTGTEGSGR
jgi:ABC-2 type transport system ATP-binding protein